MATNAQGSVPDCVGQTFVQVYEGLGQFFIDPAVGGVYFAAHQLLIVGVEGRFSAIDSFGVVEPEIVHTQQIKGSSILLATSFDDVCGQVTKTPFVLGRVCK